MSLVICTKCNTLYPAGTFLCLHCPDHPRLEFTSLPSETIKLPATNNQAPYEAESFQLTKQEVKCILNEFSNTWVKGDSELNYLLNRMQHWLTGLKN